MINQTDFSLNLFSNTFYSGNRPRAPNQQTPVKSASRIKYCCNYQKVCLHLFSWPFYSGNRPRAPNQQTPVKSASRIKYCCNYQKVCLHLFSWPCLQWMSSYFAYLTNLLFYECAITATAKGCYPESGEMYQITLEKLSLIPTSEFFFLT